MTIPAKRQSLSNMLRRLFAFLVLGGLVAICFCEPVNRKPLQRASDGCDDDGKGGEFACGNADAADVALPIRENTETRTKGRREEGRQEHVDEKARVTDEVSGRKKGKGNGRILLYMIGALKAALVYGLLNGVAALAGKAVVIAKIALAIAIAAIIKKNEPEKTSYEIVKHPHHNYIQTHSSSVDYDHRSDYGEEGYDHRKRRRILR